MRIKKGIVRMMNYCLKEPLVNITYKVNSEYLNSWKVSDKLISFDINKNLDYPFDYCINFYWKSRSYTQANYLITFSPWWYGMIGEADYGTSSLIINNTFSSYNLLDNYYKEVFLLCTFPFNLNTEEMINYKKSL